MGGTTAFCLSGTATLLRAKAETNNLIYLGYGRHGTVEYWNLHQELYSDNIPFIREDGEGNTRLYFGSIIIGKDPVGRLGIMEGAQVEWLTEKTHP